MIKRFENRIWLSSPTRHPGDFRYVEEAYQDNWISTVGANIDEVERMVVQKVGCGHAVALSCGTAALHLAVKLAGVQPGDTVFCTDMTFAASVNPILYEKGVPVFVDTEYDTWNMDPVALERAFELYPDTKVIVVANLYGTPAKFDEICAIAERHGAIIIEDAAESLGATYKGKQTGSFGTYNAISFNGNKIITGSCGGMLLTDERDAANKARKWSTQSRENAPWYQHEEVGYNYRMSNLVAGMIRGQFSSLEENIAYKRAIYERYQRGLSDLPVRMNPYDTDTMEPNFWLSCMVIDENAMCQQVRDDMRAFYKSEPGKTCPTEILETLERCNVEGRPIWKPMHMQPVYQSYEFVTRTSDSFSASGVVDVGKDIYDRGLCLPSDIKMTEDEQETIIEIVRSCFSR